jgi:hypothetical protein
VLVRVLLLCSSFVFGRAPFVLRSPSTNDGVADRLGFRQVVVARVFLTIDQDIMTTIPWDYFGVSARFHGGKESDGRFFAHVVKCTLTS